MRIETDPPKRLANLKRHKLDLSLADEAFFAAAIVVPAKKGRFMALGRIDGPTLAVVFVPLGTEAIAVISVRQASRKERQLL